MGKKTIFGFAFCMFCNEVTRVNSHYHTHEEHISVPSTEIANQYASGTVASIGSGSYSSFLKIVYNI